MADHPMSEFTQAQFNGYQNDLIQHRRTNYSHQSHSRRVPFHRESIIIEMRRRLRTEHEDRVQSFPYSSNEKESRHLYFDSIEHELEREHYQELRNMRQHNNRHQNDNMRRRNPSSFY